MASAFSQLDMVAIQEPWLKLSSEEYRNNLALQSPILSKEHARLLQENYVAMVQHLDIDYVLPYVVADNMVSDEQQQLIAKQPSRQAGIRELLSTLRKKGDQGFYSLCHATLQNKQQQGKSHFIL